MWKSKGKERKGKKKRTKKRERNRVEDLDALFD